MATLALCLLRTEFLRCLMAPCAVLCSWCGSSISTSHFHQVGGTLSWNSSPSHVQIYCTKWGDSFLLVVFSYIDAIFFGEHKGQDKSWGSVLIFPVESQRSCWWHGYMLAFLLRGSGRTSLVLHITLKYELWVSPHVPYSHFPPSTSRSRTILCRGGGTPACLLFSW